MKKYLSLLLILVMLVTSYGGALADTLKLPVNLTTIGEEAFYGTSSLDVVDIPWGTETIGSKAFANSGITKVSIPVTVNQIADDAFEGTNVTICASKISYAKTYADAHGFSWEDTNGQYSQDAQSAIDQMIDNGFSISSQKTEGMKMSALNQIDTSDIQDAELLSALQELNRMIAAANQEITEYNATIAELTEVIQEFESFFSYSSFSQENGENVITTDGVTFRVDETLINELNFSKITDMDTSGNPITLLTADGSAYAIETTYDGARLYKIDPNAAGNRSISRSVSSDIDAPKLAVDTISLLMNDLRYIVSNGMNGLTKCEKTIEKILKQYDKLEKSELLTQGYINAQWDNLSTQIDSLEGWNNKAWDNVLSLDALNKWCVALSSLSAYQTADKVRNRWARVNQIYDCNHPNEHDITPTAIDLSRTLQEDIYRIWILFFVEDIVAAGGLAADISAAFFVRVPAAVKIPDVALSGIISLFDLWVDHIYDEIIHIEKLLHTAIYGYVTDEVTQGPVENAVVFTDEAQCRTDKMGLYELYLPYDDAVTIRFSKEGYIQNGFVATLSVGNLIRRDITLNPSFGTVFGYAYNAKTKEKLPEVEVYVGENTDLSALTDKNGYYSLTLPTKEVKLTFKKDGYVDYPTSVTPKSGENVQADAPMAALSEYSGHKYAVIALRLTPTGQQAYCESLGGHLCTITSQEEQDYVHALTSGLGNVGLGGSDSGSEGNWYWMNGEPWGYSNWNSGEPNNGIPGKRGQSYLQMLGSGKWDDYYGGYDNYTDIKDVFVCEWD